MSEPIICNWVASQVSELILRDYEDQGQLPAKEEIGWRVSLGDETPQLGEGEVVIFVDHLLRGFSPPWSKFFWDFLHFLNLHPQGLGPNSISNLCQF